MRFNLVHEGQRGGYFKGVLTWCIGDKSAEKEAHSEWREVQDWFIEYRDATNPTRDAFAFTDVDEVQAKCVEVTSGPDGKLQYMVKHRLACYVDIRCEDTIDAFKAKWWSGATTDTRVFTL